MIESNQNNVVSTLLGAAGLDADDFVLQPCDVGGNNRVSAVRTNSGTYLVKWYFTSADDTRDRLDSEWRFLQYARNAGVNCVPTPLALDRGHHVALYDFIVGQKVKSGQVRVEDVEQAADFFCAINEATSAHSAELPPASEACFSIEAHMALLDGRLDRLEAVNGDGDVDVAARDLIKALRADWSVAKDAIAAGALRLGLDITRELSLKERCLSPSDFGFHNAIKTDDGTLFFIDFEYTGWDDPAKMSGDFFFQPQVSVGEEHYERFLARVMDVMINPEEACARAELLRPVFGFKWCCIMLNAFIPECSKQRFFADPARDLNEMKVRQLAKAEAAHRNLEPIRARLSK